MRFVTKRGFLWGLLILGIFFLSILWWQFPAWPNNLLTFLQGHPQLFITPGALLVIGLLFIALWRIPKWQVASLQLEAKERAELENEVRKTLAEIIGGVVILAGLYFSWETLKETRQESKVNQDNARETLKIAQEGQITERFTKAIDQLGKSGEENLAIRLGGIYALERIARDSERDHWSIMEVLTAYVREVTAWKEPQALTESKDKRPKVRKYRGVGGEILVQEPKRPKVRKLQRVDPPPRPTTDIQAILTVIGQRKREYDKDKSLNLTRTDLRGANLREAHLERANLREARLEGANLGWAHLEDANLWGAHLKRADLGGARLDRADLGWAHLEDANLSGAHLKRADLGGARLDRADLGGARLEGANLGGAHLERAILGWAHLEDANLWGSYLGGAYFLTIKQLSRVETLYEAALDDSLAEGIKKNFPHLLKNPDAK